MAYFKLFRKLKQKLRKRRKTAGITADDEVTNGSATPKHDQATAQPTAAEKKYSSDIPQQVTPTATSMTEGHVVIPLEVTSLVPSQPDLVTQPNQSQESLDTERVTSSTSRNQIEVAEASAAKTKVKLTGVEYSATGYCGLCRTHLPHNALPVLERRTEEWEQWERNCRAVLCVDLENEADCTITEEFKLLDEDFAASVSTSFKQHPIYNGVDIKLNLPSLDHNLAYVFHSWCYDVLRWKQNNSTINPVSVYNLAKSLSHEASPWETIGTNADGWLDPPSRIENLIGDMNDEESLKWQPGFLSRLPAEIRAPIWGYVGMRSAYSSFLLVSKETNELVEKSSVRAKKNLRIGKGDVLRWRSIRFFGSEYVKMLENVEGEVKEDRDVMIEEEVKGIKVIAALSGVCALKFIGESWESDWLGVVPNGGQVWYGTMEISSPTIDVTAGLTCLDIKNPESSQIQPMWDRPDYPSHLTTIDTLQHEAIFLTWQINLRTRFEFMRFLPFFRGTEATTGLTFYCNDVGIIGIAAHFSTTTIFAGYRDGLPTYVPLEKGEHVRVMHYRLGIRYEDCPSMIVETTKSRFFHVGTYMSPITQSPGCRWAPFSAFTYTRPVLGLSFQNPRREIYCAAVHGSPQQRTPITWGNVNCVKSFPTGEVPDMGSTQHEQEEEMQESGSALMGRRYTPGNGLFFSCASLRNLCIVKKCVVGRRVVGLLLQYEDGSKKVLGQWYVENTYSKARIENVYDWRDHGSQCAKSFELRLEGEEFRRIVVDVKFWDMNQKGVVNDTEESYSGYCDIGEGLCWWFSKEYDHLAPWEGTIYMIPEQNQIINALH